MKNIITIICSLTLFSVFSQNSGLKLVNYRSREVVFIKEHLRIKIKTINGQFFAGHFSVVNDTVISISNINLKLENIAFIKKESTFSTIINPISIVFGTLLIFGGIATASTDSDGPYADAAKSVGPVFIACGAPFVILPLAANKHYRTTWNYQIVNN